MRLHGQEAARDQLRQVFAGRGRGNAGQMGELTRGSVAAVDQREEYGCARRIRHQRSDCRDVTVGLHGGSAQGSFSTPRIEAGTG